MELTRLRPVLEHPGPMATVYLENRPPGEDAGTQSRLRWQSVRERLEADGATRATLTALDAALQQDPVGEVQADGRVLVACDDGVLLDEHWDASLGSGDAGYWSDVPQLDRYLREALTAVRLLVAVADQQGARIRQEVLGELGPDGSEPAEEQQFSAADSAVAGSGGARVHKARRGYLSHKHNQRRADEVVHQNAADIAAHLVRTAERFRPDVLILAGTVQGRTAVHGELPEHLARISVDADRGGVQDDAAEAALAEQIDEIADTLRSRRLAADTDAFELARSQGLTVCGPGPVADAARQGAVSTVVLGHEAADRPTGDALAASSACGADVTLVDLPEDDYTDGRRGIAAVLRFAVPTA
ncbi:baeRF2 domain-containing protein [Tomitella gaofuii]|uniref:baeRF2 domain-containing protein n=1 Tax=Tomitella gaofuii TaxID=2760083 RepID=UPI0015FE156C|nr:hypothetical protein [Tomitella gaofuii]